MTGSSRLTEARPVRIPANSFLSASTAPCMRFSSSLRSAVMSALVLDDGEGPLPAHCGGECAGFVDVEHDDGNAVLGAQGSARRLPSLGGPAQVHQCTPAIRTVPHPHVWGAPRRSPRRPGSP